MTRVTEYGPTLMAQPYCQRCQGTGFEPYLGRWRSDDPDCRCFPCMMDGINGGERR